MDMVRTEYEQDMFVYRDSTPSIRVRWYRAHPDAEMIRPYTIFGAAARSDLKVVPVGERWNLFTYKRGSWGNFGGYLGTGKPCGPADWWFRGVLPADPFPPCTCEKEMIVPFKEVPAGDTDGMNRDFTLSKMPMSNDSCVVYVNGVAQKENKDYSLTGMAIRFAGGAQPRPTSTFWVQYWYFT